MLVFCVFPFPFRALSFFLHLQIAQTIMTTLAAENIEVKFRRSWKVTYHHGWGDWVANPFEKMVNETYQDIRSKCLNQAAAVVRVLFL
jgi:hypothetical protein